MIKSSNLKKYTGAPIGFWLHARREEINEVNKTRGFHFTQLDTFYNAVDHYNLA